MYHVFCSIFYVAACFQFLDDYNEMKHLHLLNLTNLLTYMEGIFPGNGILLFKSVQQGTMEWIHCSSGSGVNVNIPYLLLWKRIISYMYSDLTD